jgi:predicted nucleic acid-binding protein
MSRRVVLDACVIVKLLVEEEGSSLARSVVATAHATGTRPLVPAHAMAEVAEVLARKVRANLISREQFDLALSRSETIAEVVALRDLLPTAGDLALEYRASIYDSLYMALAALQNVALVTADARLARIFSGTPYRDLLIAIDGDRIIFYGDG